MQIVLRPSFNIVASFVFLVILANFSIACRPKTTQQISSSQPAVNHGQVKMVFYNLENLFDTINDPANPGDDDYTPNGKGKWTTDRYQHKLNNLWRVIEATNDGQPPEIFGVCEVENNQVLTDLIHKTVLPDHYKTVHYPSPDERGIDVALVYNPDIFTVLESKNLNITLPNNDYTRDILWVHGKIANQYELHIFLNHWPSRHSNDKTLSEGNRIKAATVLKTKCDAIFKKNPDANIIIMGDFNDHPNDKSIVETLGAKGISAANNKTQLINITAELDSTKGGSYRYQGKWERIDQVIVSRAMVHKTAGLKVLPEETGYFKADFMLYNDNKWWRMPNRTFGRDFKYFGGYSDHIPAYATFTW